MIGWAAGTAVSVLLVLVGLRLPALVAGWSVTLLLPALAASRRLRQSLTPTDSVAGPAPADYVQRSLWVSAGQLGQVFLSGSDVLVIGKLLGAAAVVPYACTAKLVTIFANHPQLLIHAAQPAIAELRSNGSRERLRHVAQALTQGMLLMSGALVVTVIAANQFFVTWWVGPTQYGGLPLTLALAAMMLIRHWNVATIYTLFCFGYERQLSLVALADGVVTLGGTALLVPTLGVIGAPIASALGAVVIGLPLNLRSAAREMDVSLTGFIKPSLPLIATICAVVALAVGTTRWVDGSHFVTAAAAVAAVLIVYAVAMIPFVMLGPLRPYADTAWSMLFVRRTAGHEAAA
jgi:O-antigen/teichoic acid export membrane protein